MSHKIAYLLGAGASAQCLPVVKKMAKSIRETHGYFSQHFFGEGNRTESNNHIYQLIRDELIWLSDVCTTHYSVDTYAKKLFLNNNRKEYVRLKNVLAIYFTLHQRFILPDNRYDNFWASILTSTAHLPNNLRIISWNYDSQLELSFKNFTNSKSLADASLRLGMSSFHNNSSDIYPDEFGIFKLNGSAKIVQNRVGSSYLVDDMEADFRDFFELLFDSYGVLKELEKRNNNDIINELSFAWEHDIKANYYQKLKESIKDTTVLVVIGYSFPYFNRKIDKLIINELMPALHTVYFQAPDAEKLQERFLSMNTTVTHIHLKKDEDQFTFPNEMDI